jgi:hypothetical protein
MTVARSNAFAANDVTVRGIQIDVNNEQCRNASDPMVAIRGFASNETWERFEHEQKQSVEIFSTDDGMQIDPSDSQHPNAHSPRMEILQPASNVRFERLVQLKKQLFGMRSSDAGMQID